MDCPDAGEALEPAGLAPEDGAWEAVGGEPGAVVVVGHTGRMGSMLLREWREAGFCVSGVECLPGDAPDLDRVRAAAVVVLAVPVSALCEVLNRLAPALGPGQLLMDVTSVKVLPMLIMREFHEGPVIGSHPLFGPGSERRSRRSVLVAGRTCPAFSRLTAERLFSALGSGVTWATAREHDHGVAFAQSLNFAMSAAFFGTIARHGECLPFLTPSFKRHMEAARKHLTEDRAMFCEFTAHNPCFAEAVEAYGKTFAETLTGLDALSREAAIWFGTC